jgi:hypothetical protein
MKALEFIRKPIVMLLIVVSMLGAMIAAVACGSSAGEEHKQSEDILSSIFANQPLPNMGGYSFTREILRHIEFFEGKEAGSTYSYFLNEYTGQIYLICPSKGYPIPYAAQLSNPVQPYCNGCSMAVSQADPIGVYIPATAEGTWVPCTNADDSTAVTPQYWEPRVFATTFKIKGAIPIEQVPGTSSGKVMKIVPGVIDHSIDAKPTPTP